MPVWPKDPAHRKLLREQEVLLHAALGTHYSFDTGAAVSPGGRMEGITWGGGHGPRPPQGGSPWKGLGWGPSQYPTGLSPEESPGEVRRQREARPKPTSCTGFLDRQDKNSHVEERQLLWGGWAGWRQCGQPTAPALPFGCVCVTPHGAVKEKLPGGPEWRLGPLSRLPFPTETLWAFLGRWESEPR